MYNKLFSVHLESVHANIGFPMIYFHLSFKYHSGNLCHLWKYLTDFCVCDICNRFQQNFQVFWSHDANRLWIIYPEPDLWFKVVCLVGKRCNQSLILSFSSYLSGIFLDLINGFVLLQLQSVSICHLVNFQSSWTLLLITLISNSVSRFHFFQWPAPICDMLFI